VPLDVTFQPHARPYLIDGMANMVALGHHREAMISIVVVLEEVGWGDPQAPSSHAACWINTH
jgi:hypothetical protein